MSKQIYTHVQELLPEIRAMAEAGKTQREIVAHFGLVDNYGIKPLLKRKLRKEKRLAAGISERPKGHPRKDAAPRDVVAEQTYEINRLKTKNRLLRNVL